MEEKVLGALAGAAATYAAKETAAALLARALPENLHHVVHAAYVEPHHLDARLHDSVALTAEQAAFAVFEPAAGAPPYLHELRGFQRRQALAEDVTHHVIVAPVTRQYAFLVSSHAAMEVARREDVTPHSTVYCGSDGMNFLYQCVRDALPDGFLARIATAVAPGSYAEKVWFFNCFLRTGAARTREAFGNLLAAVGHRGGFGFTLNMAYTVLSFSFDDMEQARRVQADEARIAAEAGLRADDVDFGEVQETFTGDCAHSGAVERNRKGRAVCTGCRRIIGNYEDWA